jgi:hypothetical protein
MLGKRSILQWFARQRKPLSARESRQMDHPVDASRLHKKPRTMPGL